ncbi:unnamed protein product [Discosporangium mesarthrocarpum]
MLGARYHSSYPSADCFAHTVQLVEGLFHGRRSPKTRCFRLRTRATSCVRQDPHLLNRMSADDEQGLDEEDNKKTRTEIEKRRHWRRPKGRRRRNQVVNMRMIYVDIVIVFTMVVARQLGQTLADPDFAGWFAPPEAPHLLGTIEKASALSICWITSSICIAVFGREEFTRSGFVNTVTTWLPACILYWFGVVATAPLLQEPIVTSEVLGDALVLLLAMLACRQRFIV